LDDSYTIDIYGPIHDDKYTKEYFKSNGIEYKGMLKSEEVLSTLASYDVLLLPSYKEGYPGIVIESYSVGIPIVSTNLIGLKEITDEYKTGILVEAQNVEELKSAMEYFNDNNYSDMARYAKEKFLLFNAEEQTNIFWSTITTK